MARPTDGGASIVAPGSITDFAKALREVINALRDVGQLIGDTADLYDRRKARTAAGNLATLGFSKRGMRGPLERIVAGSGSSQDIEELAQRLTDTAGEVEDSIGALDRYRDRLREKLGMSYAMKFDDIIHGPVGKQMIRYSLQDIVSMGGQETPNAVAIRARAQEVTGWIEHLNVQLIELHDLLLPPTSASKKRKPKKPT